MKSKEVRVIECLRIRKKLAELGLPDELPAIAELLKLMRDYVDNGVGTSGTIPFPEARRKIVYKFSTNIHIESTVILRNLS